LFLLSLFRGVLTGIAGFLGIAYAPSLLFALSGLFAIMIILSQAVAITTLARRNRDLAQKIALLEWHLEHIQEEIKNKSLNDRELIDKNTSEKQALLDVSDTGVHQWD
jgi:hypothetical protein